MTELPQESASADRSPDAGKSATVPLYSAEEISIRRNIVLHSMLLMAGLVCGGLGLWPAMIVALPGVILASSILLPEFKIANQRGLDCIAVAFSLLAPLFFGGPALLLWYGLYLAWRTSLVYTVRQVLQVYVLKQIQFTAWHLLIAFTWLGLLLTLTRWIDHHFGTLAAGALLLAAASAAAADFLLILTITSGLVSCLLVTLSLGCISISWWLAFNIPGDFACSQIFVFAGQLSSLVVWGNVLKLTELVARSEAPEGDAVGVPSAKPSGNFGKEPDAS